MGRGRRGLGRIGSSGFPGLSRLQTMQLTSIKANQEMHEHFTRLTTIGNTPAAEAIRLTIEHFKGKR